MFGYPSWKVIVSAQRGQYLEPGSSEPGFFSMRIFTKKHFHDEKDAVRLTVEPSHRIIAPMITNACTTAVKKASLSGASDWRAR
jgi:hypothetical protein